MNNLQELVFCFHRRVQRIKLKLSGLVASAFICLPTSLAHFRIKNFFCKDLCVQMFCPNILMYSTFVLGVIGGVKKALNPLELEFQWLLSFILISDPT